MVDYSFNEKQETSFFSRNKLVSISIIIACMLFLGIFIMEKSQSVINMVPMLRGEISFEDGFSITTTKNRYPILIKKDDPFIGSQLRFSGDVKSIFSETAISLAQNDEIVVEIGAHFGYNVLNIAKKTKGLRKYYAFEPNCGVLSCLRKSVVLNDLDDIVVLRDVAISDEKKSFPIDDCLSVTKTPRGEYTKPRTIIVNSNTLDDELENEPLTSISMLLIDIPGSEFSILKGAEKIIANSPDIKIIISFNNKASSEYFDIENELKKMEQQGFIFYLVETLNNYTQVNIPDILSKKEVVIIMTKNKLNFDSNLAEADTLL
ncbi:MAG: FkbM family methyltransferase [Holosporaceae bacterium]|nr:FkbM family methyltransferase [Holosporaceae bacterium]